MVALNCLCKIAAYVRRSTSVRYFNNYGPMMIYPLVYMTGKGFIGAFLDNRSWHFLSKWLQIPLGHCFLPSLFILRTPFDVDSG